MIRCDFIVVGCGLASIAFCEQLRTKGLSFIVFDNSSQQSSKVAAGLYNPVILKRFTPVWKAKEQLKLVQLFHQNIQKFLNIQIDFQLKIFRRFSSIEEQNLWFTASDKPNLEPYLSTRLIPNQNPNIDAPFQFGEVQGGGRWATEKLITVYQNFLKNNALLFQDTFNYKEIIHDVDTIRYNNIQSKAIVFAEGFGVKQNPYFSFVPINGTKGELLTIKAPNLKLNSVIKSSVFVIPLENDLYTVGSTYNWEDKTNTPTKEAKQNIIHKLQSFIKCDFEVTNHSAGIRPTTLDRRPIIGNHPKFKNIYIINGLGTRGVMIAPYAADILSKYILDHLPIANEINVNRFF